MKSEELMKYFNFDESELDANRNGRLSEKQSIRLQKKETRAKKGSIGLGVVYLVIAILGPSIAIGANFLAVKEEPGLVIGFAIMFGLIWPLIWGAIGSIFVRRAFEKMNVKVKKVRGPINIVKAIREEYNSSTKLHSEYSVHELHVGKRTFEVESEIADVMMQGDVYAVYYADINIESSEDPILSVELLEQAK